MIVYIGCVKEKLDHRAKAEDLYISDLFKKELAYARSLNPDHIYILSAKHYLLDLNDIIAPYDETLNDMSAEERKSWAEKVIDKIKEKHISLDKKSIFLAGSNYTEYLVEYFSKAVCPYDKLDGIGYILSWLDKHTPNKYKEMKEGIKSLKTYLIESIKSKPYKDNSDFYKSCQAIDDKYYWTPWNIVDHIKLGVIGSPKSIAKDLFDTHVSEFLESNDYKNILKDIKTWEDKDRDLILKILEELNKLNK